MTIKTIERILAFIAFAILWHMFALLIFGDYHYEMETWTLLKSLGFLMYILFFIWLYLVLMFKGGWGATLGAVKLFFSLRGYEYEDEDDHYDYDEDPRKQETDSWPNFDMDVDDD